MTGFVEIDYEPLKANEVVCDQCSLVMALVGVCDCCE